MKLLNLPLIPLQDVLKQLELSELFTISLCSLRSKKLVKIMKFGFETTGTIQIELFDNDSRDTVISIGSGEKKSKVVILENGFLLEEDTTILKIGGMEIPCEVSWCSYGVVYIKHDPEIQPSTEIIDYLCELFNIPSETQQKVICVKLSGSKIISHQQIFLKVGSN